MFYKQYSQYLGTSEKVRIRLRTGCLLGQADEKYEYFGVGWAVR